MARRFGQTVFSLTAAEPKKTAGIRSPHGWNQARIETQEITKRIDLAVMVGEFGALKSCGAEES